MKDIHLAGIVALTLILGSAPACTKKGVEATQGTQPAAMSPMEAMGELRNDFAVLVDVREDSEIKESGMAEPAKWMPTSKINANDPEWQKFVQQLPKDKRIVFYCAAGGRAGKVAELLSSQGFRTANIGGFKDWAAAGLPVKKAP